MLCASDLIAGVLRGRVFWGAKACLELSNLIFYECLTVISYLWMIYVYVKLDAIRSFGRKTFLWSIPLMLFSLVAISNPFTHILFTINDHNLFVRNTGTYFHWVVTWMYLIIATVKTACSIFREKNRNKRREAIPLLSFIIAPTVAGVIQMLFYGVTSSQVGITFSLTLIFLIEQSDQILSDSLTGLNNRHSFNQYLASHIPHHSGENLTLFMIDINNFKQVNDKFGHIAGDHALNVVAEVLKQVSSESQNRLFLCRYGGDEFLIAAFDRTPEEANAIKAQIYEALEKKAQEIKAPYALSVSVGFATGTCSDYDGAAQLLRIADEAMYAEKKLFKKANAAMASRA